MTDNETLAAIEHEHGPKAVARALGAWLAINHRERSSLYRFKVKPARAPHYLAYVRELPCCACDAPPPSDPDHIGPRGMGTKTDDYRTIPLCRTCHQQRHLGDLEIDWQRCMIGTLVWYLCRVEGSE